MAEEAAAPVPPAEGEEVPQGEAEAPEELEPVKPPCVDLTSTHLKIDHFDQMHVLGEEGKLSGAPNYRQVCGFPVFGTAQPTVEGFKQVLEKIKRGPEDNPRKAIWFNTRQEPVVYINNISYAPRTPDRMHENMDLSHPTPDLANLQRYFTQMINRRLETSGDEKTLKIHKDAAFTENPMEREDVEESVKVTELLGMHDIYPTLKNIHPTLECVLAPVVEDKAPEEEWFDTLVNALKDEPAATQCIFSCQMGRGRTTLGMIVACLIKELKVSTELRKMSEIQLVSDNTISSLIKQKFESPLKKRPDDDDPFIKGEFDVIKELVAKEPGADAGKRKIDRIIDLCGPAPKGTGLQNMRECIIETKWKYDVAPEEKQVVWKQMILNFMERYFYLICFATYALEFGPTGFQSSFKEWMDKRAHLRTMIDEGKDKLEWYRQVDPAKLNTLKDLINAPNYKDNLGVLIKTIYEFAFLTYADLPRGPIKNNSMRKLAAKTLMEILPPDIGVDIQKKLDEHASSPDFVTLIGLVSYHGREEPVV